MTSEWSSPILEKLITTKFKVKCGADPEWKEGLQCQGLKAEDVVRFSVSFEWRCERNHRQICNQIAEIPDKTITLKILGGEAVQIDIDLICTCETYCQWLKF